MSFCINVYEPFADFTKDRSYSNWILKKKWYLINLIKNIIEYVHLDCKIFAEQHLDW